jgi:dienelactone hydrolase
MDHFQSGGMDINLEIFKPSGIGKYPAIVVVYGTRGLTKPFGDGIRDFATKIATQGYIVCVPYYFERTKTVESSDTAGDITVTEAFVNFRDTWIETIQDCITYATSLSNVTNNKIGLLAFSMGGHLSLRLAKSGKTPKINALVEFFAPITQAPFNSLGGNIDKLPPVQIHHGTNDTVVNKSQSELLVQALESAGKKKDIDYEIHFYPGEGHGFSSLPEISKSITRTIDYFKKHVK